MNPVIFDEDQSTSSLSVSNVFVEDSASTTYSDNHLHHHHHNGHYYHNQQQRTSLSSSPQHSHPHEFTAPTRRISSNRPRRRASVQSSLGTSFSGNNRTSKSHASFSNSSHSEQHNNNNDIPATPDRRNNRNLFSLASASGHLSNNSNNLQDPPPLSVVTSQLFLWCSLYCQHTARQLKKPCTKVRRILTIGICSVFAVVFLLVAWLAYDFYRDAVAVCRPSVDVVFQQQQQLNNNKPLVEYYVHGRYVSISTSILCIHCSF
jgi:hypothetical protein